MGIRVYLLGFATLAILLSGPAWAQSQRTFVSNTGVNTPAYLCSEANPCATIAYALTQTNAGGEVVIMNPGSFGSNPNTINITQAVTIEADGTYGGVAISAGADAFAINAPSNAVVTLRGLTINGLSASGHIGITFTTGAALHVENCIITGMEDAGIFFNPSVTTTRLFVKDTIFRDNAIGIYMEQGYASLSNVRIENNSNDGLAAAGGSNLAEIGIQNSVFSGNGTGILAYNNGDVNVESTLIANNTTGVEVHGNTGTVRLSYSTIIGNATGLNAMAG